MPQPVSGNPPNPNAPVQRPKAATPGAESLQAPQVTGQAQGQRPRRQRRQTVPRPHVRRRPAPTQPDMFAQVRLLGAPSRRPRLLHNRSKVRCRQQPSVREFASHRRRKPSKARRPQWQLLQGPPQHRRRPAQASSQAAAGPAQQPAQQQGGQEGRPPVRRAKCRRLAATPDSRHRHTRHKVVRRHAEDQSGGTTFPNSRQFACQRGRQQGAEGRTTSSHCVPLTTGT